MVQNKIYWNKLLKHRHTNTFKYFFLLQSVTLGHCLPLKYICKWISEVWLNWKQKPADQYLNTSTLVCSHVSVFTCMCVRVCMWVCVRLPWAVLVGPMPDSLLSGIWWGLVMFYMHSPPWYIMDEAHLPSKRQNNRDWDIRWTDTETCACMLVWKYDSFI